ncbi:Myb-like DNA-Hypothetical protein domain [Nesidiocoris tenuis]|uniref:ZZ-type domain-containing protein n=1 Tax=Nesidiocoris tenuis TaxID=355587 RepID=A0ABN7B569_9HEMI|nr:Myb-like DNA-Hypothetical protein domain [Nesidiocoris tenuis]
MADYFHPSNLSVIKNDVLDDVFGERPYQEPDDGTFSFESDYLALKGNPDYLRQMRALVVLQSQRSKILEDIDALEDLKVKADFDPEGVKKLIMDGQSPFLMRLNLEKVPEVDWSRYKSYDPTERAARRNKGERSASVATKSPAPETQAKSDTNEPIKVRGRPYHEKKPETFNQLWTVEEQLRLEELLEQFPPEPVENQRWKKIAAALGNRTTKQVCSRVQKYFKKLKKEGLAAPTKGKSTRAGHIHKKYKRHLYKPTTFFPGAAMGELGSDSSDDEIDNAPDDLSHWDEIQRKIDKWRAEHEDSDDESNLKAVLHVGFRCLECGQDPIEGLRWNCRTCPTYSVCSRCMETMIKRTPPPHQLTHHFLVFEEPYLMPNYDNYLDPSFAL